MSKLTLQDVTNIDSLSTINSNFDKIEQALQDKVLYRDNPVGEPNTVEHDIDLNGFRILNVSGIDTTGGSLATTDVVEAIQADVTVKHDNVVVKHGEAIAARDLVIDAYNATVSTYTAFDTNYLGEKASDPLTDNNGNTLKRGALYFKNTSPQIMRVYNGLTWQDVGSISATTTNTIDPSLYASLIEAQQGTNNTKVMTPLRVADAIEERVYAGFDAFGPIRMYGDAVDPLEPATLQQVTSLFGSIIPAGAVMAFARSTPPSGWVECAGQTVPISSYSALYSAIGNTYGPAPAGYFVLPDLRGEFIRGWDHGRNVDPGRALGSNAGANAPTHIHQWYSAVTTDGSTADRIITKTTNYTSKGRVYNNSGVQADLFSSDPLNGFFTSEPANEVGDTAPRSVALMYCIKR
jgi:microcystin-dependent protein